MKKNKKSYGLNIMLNLLVFTKPMIFPIGLAVLTGIIGFLLSFGLGIFGGYGLLTLIGSQKTAFSDLPFGGHSINWYIAAMIICAFFRSILHYIEQLCNHFIAFRILAEIRGQVFNAMRKLAPAKLENKNKGSLISIITADIELLEVFFAHTISPIIIAAGTGIALIVFYAFINPYLMLSAAVFYILVGIVIPFIAGKKGNAIALSLRNEIGNLNGQFLDCLRGIREVIQYNVQESTVQEIEDTTKELLDKQRRLRKQGATVAGMTDVLIVISGICMLLLAGLLCYMEKISPSEGFIACLTIISTFGPFIAIANLGNTLSHTLAAGERVLGILNEKPEVYPVTDGVDVDFEGIDVKDLDFGYGEETVLENVNLSINKGEILGIQGKSGSGKSTLLKLIMRFWKPNGGMIAMSGVDIEKINSKSLLNNITYITQDTVLFAGTVEENLRIARKDEDMQTIKAACEKAGILKHIESLPKGFDTQVAELGDNFSGGERQRLGLARCFLADSPLIFLDEPTSNLDSQNESIILKALYKTKGEKTIVMVSHRESTLAISDRVYEMENGRL